MSKFLLLNFQDFGLNQDITKTIQSRALMCVCCLAKDVPFVNIVTCSHKDFLDKFLVNYELKPMYQVVCQNCHGVLKNIQVFHEQVDASFKLLMSETTDNQTNKPTTLSCHKTVDILLPQLDEDMESEHTSNATQRLTNIQTGLDILKRNMDSISVIAKGIDMLKNMSTDVMTEQPLVRVKQENVEVVPNVTSPSGSVIKVESVEVPTTTEPDQNSESSMNVGDSSSNTDVPVAAEEPLKSKPAETESISSVIETVTLTKEEFLEEKSKLMEAKAYLKFKHRCDDCVQGFNYNENLMDHMKRKHYPRVGSATCELCLQTLYPPGSINAHMYVHYTRYKCTVCSKMFRMSDDALKHYRKTHAEHTIHTSGKTSTQRSREYRARQKMFRTSQTDSLNPFTQSKTSAERGREYRERQKLLQASGLCTKTAAQRHKEYRERRKRRAAESTDSQQSINIATSTSRMRKFRDRSRIKKSTSNTHDTRYKCTVCNTMFNTYNDGIGHYRKTHMDGKAFKCKSCPFASMYLNKLKRHSLKHQLLKCRYCELRFTSTLDQKKHLTQVHGVKPTGVKKKIKK